MSIWKTIIMGIVQGLTEFLPVSSSGHQIFIGKMIGADLVENGLFLNITLHIGTLLAVFFAFHHEIGRLVAESIHIIRDSVINVGRFIQNLFGGQRVYRKIISNSYRKYTLLLLVSTLPTGIVGMLLRDMVKLSEQILLVPALCLLVTGLYLFLADRAEPGTREPKEVSWGSALFVGTAQGIAVIPGISRSGATIAACLLNGFDSKFAVKYSFILSVPAVAGALVLDLWNMPVWNISQENLIMCGTGGAVAAIFGYLAICLMLALVHRKKYKYFAIYCWVVGIAAAIWYFMA